MSKNFVLKGAFLILCSIILGAFGAHLLKEIFTETQLKSFEVGVRYQMYAGLFLLLIGLNYQAIKFKLSGVLNLFFMGSLFFSLSIYGINFFNHIEILKKVLGPITPIGGMFMIISIIVFIVKVFKAKSLRG